jgi:hypothetical protein
MLGPRIFSTGYILYGAKNANKAEVESLDDARHHLQRLKAVGAFSVKSYNQPRRTQRQWIIEAARERADAGRARGRLAPRDEPDDVPRRPHRHRAQPPGRAALPRRDRLFAHSGTGITPTLIVAYGGLNGEYWWYQHDRVFEKEPLRSLTPPGWLDERARRRDVFAFDDDFQHVKIAQACRDLLRAGAHLQLGAHGQLQGSAPHWELWMLGRAA